MLRVVAELGGVAGLALAAIDGDLAGEDLEQGGLAGAVGADEHDAVAALDGEVEVLVDALFAVGLADFGELDDFLVGARRLGEGELEGLARGAGFLDAFELFEELDAGLDLRGFGPDLAEAVDEFLVALDFLVLVSIGLDALLVGFFPLVEVGAVVSGVGNELRGIGIDLDDGLDDGVHEIAVVGDHEDGAGVVEQVALEPEQREQVEVVGGLVEHEQVRLHDEELGEVGAHDPAAGVFAGGLVEVVLLEAEAGEDLLGLGFELVAVEVGELVLGLGEIRMREVAGFLVLAHGAEDADHFRSDAHGDLDDRFIGGLAGFLGEVAGDGDRFPLQRELSPQKLEFEFLCS